MDIKEAMRKELQCVIADEAIREMVIEEVHRVGIQAYIEAVGEHFKKLIEDATTENEAPDGQEKD